MEALYTVEKAAEYLEMDTVTLWRLRKARKISCRKSGRWIRFTESDLNEYLERIKHSAETEPRRVKRK